MNHKIKPNKDPTKNRNGIIVVLFLMLLVFVGMGSYAFIYLQRDDKNKAATSEVITVDESKDELEKEQHFRRQILHKTKFKVDYPGNHIKYDKDLPKYEKSKWRDSIPLVDHPWKE